MSLTGEVYDQEADIRLLFLVASGLCILAGGTFQNPHGEGNCTSSVQIHDRKDNVIALVNYWYQG